MPLTPGTRALVLGLGRFGGGLAATRYLVRHGAVVRIADRATREALPDAVEALTGLPIDWCLGDESPAVLDGIDLAVVNPAIPDTHPLLAAIDARGIERTQEVGLFLDAYPGRTVLVTGTNGKSTTTTLLGAALRANGIDTLVGGNIGHSLLEDEARWAADQIAVLEISSFQLERLDSARHRAAGAVFTPVTRDHLDRHGSLAAYHRAKSIAAAIATDFVVHGRADAVAAGFATTAPIRLVHDRDGGPTAAAWCDHGFLWIGGTRDPGPLVHKDALRLVGAFHIDNALAAALAALECGARRARTGLAIAQVEPLPYRLQLAATLDGVRWFDNGVSTGLESTLSALESLGGTVHWIGGGKSKEGPEGYPAFARAIAAYVRSAHVFGAAAMPMQDAMRAVGVAAQGHERLEAAAAAVRDIARPGDAVLFSPGFASFDQFQNFRARADAFRAWLAAARAPRADEVSAT